MPELPPKSFSKLSRTIGTGGDALHSKGRAPITGGPYRFLRHPNYLAVVVEIAALPLLHGAWLTAAVFSAANAMLLAVRIREEEAALARHSPANRRPAVLNGGAAHGH